MAKKGLRQTFFQRIVRLLSGQTRVASLSRYEQAKLVWQTKKTIKRELWSALLMMVGVFSAAFGLRGFLIPNQMIDGGAMGISLLIDRQTSIPLSVLIVLVNLPFLLIAWKQIGPVFSLKSIIAIFLLSVVVAIFPFPHITEDKLLVSVFGGFFLGTGIGLAIRGGGVIDGTEVLALYLARKNSPSVGDFILIFNLLIFSVAAWLINIETALYSVLIYMAASRTVDFILDGIEEFTGVTIISPHSDEIALFIREKMGRGLTVYSGKKGYGKRGENQAETDIIFTIVTRLEISRLTSAIEKMDPHAFIVMHSIRDTKGGMVKKKGFA